MNGFRDENEFRKWQAAVALQYGIELVTVQQDRRRKVEAMWPKHPDEVVVVILVPHGFQAASQCAGKHTKEVNEQEERKNCRVD